ncbi:hypothetical protein ACL2XP_21770 [Sodalis sp. RH21]|uniref:hypothetical protein n=1 Tax=unclassified Sodalis (in: enterobacteria) TaxID=2636512 RepID=UPI0039B3E1EB
MTMINREILKQCSALSTLTPLIDYINNLKSPINLEVIEYLNAERNLQDKEEKHNFLRTLTTDLYKLSQLPAVDTRHRQLAHKILTTPICGLAFQQYGNIDQPALGAIFADTANHRLITDEMLALLGGLQQDWTLGGDSGQ